MSPDSIYKKFKDMGILFAQYSEFVAFLLEFVEEYGLVEEFETWLKKRAESATKKTS